MTYGISNDAAGAIQIYRCFIPWCSYSISGILHYRFILSLQVHFVSCRGNFTLDGLFQADPATHYNAGVTASFEEWWGVEWNVSGASVDGLEQNPYVDLNSIACGKMGSRFPSKVMRGLGYLLIGTSNL